jgi:NADPH:quinone reductase-like Zn-dependent oxidoreductase
LGGQPGLEGDPSIKAAIYRKYGPPEVLQIKEVETPVPKAKEVRIRVRATTVTGSDILVRGFMLTGWMAVLGRLALGITDLRDPILGFILAGEIDTYAEHGSNCRFHGLRPLLSYGRFKPGRGNRV